MIEFSIVMPCLNEAATVATCIAKARGFLARSGIDGEIVIGDNGSTDGSPVLARDAGAVVIDVPERGYGAALRGAFAKARGTYVVMGDADDSYDFGALDLFVARLRAGFDLVVGNRFAGGIAAGAMPPLHHLGVPALSALGRWSCGAPVGDFHCGLRGFRREAMAALALETSGMELASEMIVKAAFANLRICEVPTTLSPDGRAGPGHLRTFRDGLRHVRYLAIARYRRAR